MVPLWGLAGPCPAAVSDLPGGALQGGERAASLLGQRSCSPGGGLPGADGSPGLGPALVPGGQPAPVTPGLLGACVPPWPPQTFLTQTCLWL